MSIQPPAPSVVSIPTPRGGRRRGTVIDAVVEADAEGIGRTLVVDVDGTTLRVDEDDAVPLAP